MSTPPALTDRAALRRNRARMRPDAMFLHQIAVDEVQDRIASVNKSFTKPAVVTGNPDFWTNRLANTQHVKDTDALTLAPATYDLVIHAMSLHWANDPVGQLIQSRHAMQPDGFFLAACFGGQTLHELRSCFAQAEVEISGGLSPRIAPMAELRDLGALLQRAGFALPVADSQSLTVEYRDIWHLMQDLRDMGESNALMTRLRRPSRRAIFDKAARLYKAHFSTPEGKITATFELIFLTGWAPSANQPKPLRPGSAKQRLADALATTETPLKD